MAQPGTDARLQPGQRAPDFAAPLGVGGPATRFYGVAGGRPAVIVLAARPVLGEVAALSAALGEGATVHPVVSDPPGESDVTAAFHDGSGRIHAAYRVDPSGPPTVVLCDPNLRVLDVMDLPAAQTHASGLLAASIPPSDDRRIELQAPVLCIPRVLDDAFCAELMAVWDSSSEETGVEASADGRRALTLAAAAKRRRDHIVTNAALSARITQAVGLRVMPELRKAFAYQATRFEGFKIACYDAANQGFFTAHRDNLSPQTAHRRFALTLNLNQGYTGGELRFPEYGDARYCPPAGAALIFSGATLHEVLPVTAHRRFVLLSFLFADEPRRAA